MIMSTRRLGVVAGTALLVAALGGCGGSSNLGGESHQAILLNPTPVEQTPIMTAEDIDNRIYGITIDQNFLMLRDDLNRILLLERPSRLTPYPVAY